MKAASFRFCIFRSINSPRRKALRIRVRAEQAFDQTTGSRAVPAQGQEGSTAGVKEARVPGLGKCGFSFLRGTARSRSLRSRTQFPRDGGKRSFTRAVRGRGEHGRTGTCKAIWHGPAAQRMVQAGLLHCTLTLLKSSGASKKIFRARPTLRIVTRRASEGPRWRDWRVGLPWGRFAHGDIAFRRFFPYPL